MKNLVTLILIVFVVSSCNNQVNTKTSESDSVLMDQPAQEAVSGMNADPGNNPDMTEFAAEVDVNKDGQMSKEEWESKGLPMSSFNMFENGRGYVTLEDYQVNAAPAGIDLNGDGKLTVEEFVEFDKTMSANMPSGDNPPPDAPGGSAAPPAGEAPPPNN